MTSKSCLFYYKYSINNLIPFPIPSISFNINGTFESFSNSSTGGSIDFIAIRSLRNSTPELKMKSNKLYKG